MPKIKRMRQKPTKTGAMNIADLAASYEPTDEQIRMRAYEIYVARGDAPGTPDGDWLQAKLELRARLALLGQA